MTAAVSCGTSHMTTKQYCQHTTLVELENVLCIIALVVYSELHMTSVQRVCSEVENSTQ